MKRVNPIFQFLGYALIPVVTLISMITGHEVLIFISLILLNLLLVALTGIILYLVLQRFIERIATIKSWSYSWDDKYSGYSIKANRSLFRMSWSTNEYLSTTEEEAKNLIDLKNGTTMIMFGKEGHGNSYSFSDRQLFIDKNK